MGSKDENFFFFYFFAAWAKRGWICWKFEQFVLCDNDSATKLLQVLMK